MKDPPLACFSLQTVVAKNEWLVCPRGYGCGMFPAWCVLAHDMMHLAMHRSKHSMERGNLSNPYQVRGSPTIPGVAFHFILRQPHHIATLRPRSSS